MLTVDLVCGNTLADMVDLVMALIDLSFVILAIMKFSRPFTAWFNNGI